MTSSCCWQMWNKLRWLIAVTSRWAAWRLKSPASGMFAQSFVQVNIKENNKGLRHWPLWGNPPVTGSSPHKGPVTRKMFPFDDVIMCRSVYIPWTACIGYQCSTTSVHAYENMLGQIMMTSSNGNIFRVTGHLCGEFTVPCEFPAQRPVTRSFDVFFDLRPNKRLSKQPLGWWFETPHVVIMTSM